MTDIDARIDALDLGLFAEIPSQTSDEEKRSLLALQAGVRRARREYVYLEIGSHLVAAFSRTSSILAAR